MSVNGRKFTPSLRAEDVQHEWHVIDAKDQVLGRLATQIATIIRGKNKPTFTPHIDGGDFVVVINAKHIKLTGNKLEDKHYYRHSGYPGGIKSETAKERLEKYPERIIEDAVWGMLPKHRLGRKILKKVKIYAGAEHPHEAQVNTKEEKAA